jgi:threonine/homoserine/homoserine lactone efflux protein
MSKGRCQGIAFGPGCTIGCRSHTLQALVGGWLNHRPHTGLWLDRVAGTVFIGLGLRMVMAR